MGTYGRYDLAMESGSGRVCKGEDGRSFIDFGSGIGVNSFGYCDGEWADAVSAQAHKLQHCSNYYYTKVQAELAEMLCSAAGYAKVFFGNSGAEANECAIKIARKYSFDKYGKGRSKILTLKNSFHGRTVCTLSATGQDIMHQYFFPFVPDFDYVEAGNTAELEEKLDSTVCAVMLEFIQGEGGVVPLKKEFVKEVFKLCAAKDVLVIADEVQTGVGRTGKLLCAEHYGVRADITTLAKGLGGGLPIGVCLAKDRCAEVLTKGTHGSTFGGNPVVCAGALSILSRVREPVFLDEVARKGRYMKVKLEQMKGIKQINGKGLMIGAVLDDRLKAADIAKACYENGLLILTAKTNLRFLPPLNISFGEIESGLEILAAVLERASSPVSDVI